MFSGPDAQLVQDAVIFAALAATAGIGAVFTVMRLRDRKPEPRKYAGETGNLEERVKVLERIATDRSIGLADEIEALRGQKEDA